MSEPKFDSEDENEDVIKIFGEDASDIHEGDKLRAHVRYVEGRKVVELTKI